MTASLRQYRYHGVAHIPEHLIPYLQDDQKATDDLRQVRWPKGVTCPRCGTMRSSRANGATTDCSVSTVCPVHRAVFE